ncbi:hypothetical protein SAMD00079811_82460 (plasmid) [Scytonema sp. HK-05]|nr:hypothetical protein SAMD00079811_82460 [Scytonema sp. HK-05]
MLLVSNFEWTSFIVSLIKTMQGSSQILVVVVGGLLGGSGSGSCGLGAGDVPGVGD